ncbi:MAG: hypothetical protein LBC47_01595 [Tannerella sp.]|nr:hypothetical protein [Tannerella sp.]
MKKRDKQKANGTIPLFCRITVGGQKVRFGMKCDINPKFWDVKADKASGRIIPRTFRTFSGRLGYLSDV